MTDFDLDRSAALGSKLFELLSGEPDEVALMELCGQVQRIIGNKNNNEETASLRDAVEFTTSLVWRLRVVCSMLTLGPNTA